MFDFKLKEFLLKKPSVLAIILILSFPILLSCKSEHIIGEKKKMREIGLVVYKYKSGNWEERVEAVQEISTYDTLPHSIKALRLLIEATYDNHTAVQIEAIKKLAAFPSLVSRDRLSQLALESTNFNINWYALRSLALYRDPLVAPVFIQGLNNSDWLIREVSIKAILMLESSFLEKSMIGPIVQALRDSSSSVRLATLQNIKFKNPALIKEIKNILTKKNQNKVFVIASLKALRGYRLDRELKERIIKYLTDRNREIRILALRVLQEEESLIDNQ